MSARRQALKKECPILQGSFLTISNTLLTIEALHKRDIKPLGVVFIDAGKKPAPQDMISENIEAVEGFSGIKAAGVISRIKNFSNPEKECYQPIKRICSSQVSGGRELFIRAFGFIVFCLIPTIRIYLGTRMPWLGYDFSISE